MTKPPLESLAAQLKACPAKDQNCSAKRLLELWNSFRQLSLENRNELTPAHMAGLLLHDSKLSAALLSETERASLAALVNTALERFQDKTHHKLGQTMADAIKESL